MSLFIMLTLLRLCVPGPFAVTRAPDTCIDQSETSIQVPDIRGQNLPEGLPADNADTVDALMSVNEGLSRITKLHLIQN